MTVSPHLPDLLGRARSRAARGRRGAAGPGPGARRGRHRQDPRDHPPDRPRRRHGHLRADRGARGHLHHPCRRRDAWPAPPPRRPRRPGAHVPQRGPAPAAVVLADDVRRRAADPDRVEARDGRRGRPPAARRRPTRRCCATSPPRSSGPRSATSAPTTTPRSPTARGRAVGGVDHETVGRLFGGYEEVKRSQARMDMEDVLLLTAGMLAEEERVAAQVRAQYKWFVVDEFQDVSPIQSALLDLWLGGRDEICVVGDPAQTIYSFAGADADVPPRLPAQVPRHHLGRALPQLPLHARGGRRGQRRARRLGDRRRCACAPSARAARRCATLPAADEVAEADAVADAVGGLVADGVPASEIAVLFRINAQSEAFEEALASPRHRPTSCAAPRGSSSGPRCGRRSPCSAAPPAPTASATPLLDLVRATLAGMGWTTEAPADARPDARPLGVAAGAGDHGRGGRATLTAADFVADLDRRASEQHAPGGRRRHPGHAPRRQGPGVGRRLPRRHARRCDAARPTPTTAGGDRGGAPAPLRRHDPRPRAPRRVVGRGPHARAAAATGSRRASSTGLLPDEARAASATPKAAPRGPLPRVRQAAVRARRRRSAAAAPTAPRRTTRSCSSACACGARSRADEESVPAFVVFTDATLQLIAEQRPTSAGGPAAHQRGRSGQARAVRRRRSRGRRIGRSSTSRKHFLQKYPQNGLPLTSTPR